jgi:hypothetical protein
MLPRHAPLPLRRHRSECPDHLLPRHAPLPLCRHRSECLDHLLPSPPGRQAAAKQREGGLSSAVELVPGSSVIITRKEKNAGIFSLSLLIAVAFLPVLNCWFVCWRKDWVNQRLPCSADSAAKILWLIEHTVTVAGSYSAKTAQRKFQKKKLRFMAKNSKYDLLLTRLGSLLIQDKIGYRFQAELIFGRFSSLAVVRGYYQNRGSKKISVENACQI